METDALAKPLSDALLPVASPWHTFLVLAVIGASVFRGRLQADQMRVLADPNRTALYARIILSEWLTLALVLVGVWLNGSSPRTVLGDRWRDTSQFLRDIGIGLLFLVLTIIFTSTLGSHGGTGDRATQFLLPQRRVEFAIWVVLSITAGICEEAIYRGYLQKQFAVLTKSITAGIALSALTFGVAHAFQGIARASSIAVLGAMGGILACWRRSVRPGMIAHALQDLLGAVVRH